MATRVTTRPSTPFFSTQRGRVLTENLTAYLFLLPAGVIVFLFGLFPVAFALLVSLYRWRRFPGDYQGLANYTRALDHFAYVLFFWLALTAIVAAVMMLRSLLQVPERKALLALLPGLANGLAGLLFLRWVALLLPIIINIPQTLRGQDQVRGLFIDQLFKTFQLPQAADAGNAFLAALIVGALLTVLVARFVHVHDIGRWILRAGAVFLFLGLGLVTLQLTADQINAAVEAARATGQELPLWSQVLLISAGAGLLLAAYLLWQRALKQDGRTVFALYIVAAIALMAGGYFLVTELPPALANADTSFIHGAGITIMFVIGTVPIQLALGLGLSYLLFQNIRGKAFFRMMYFLPYITPFVATSVVFTLLFAQRGSSPANQVLAFLHIPQQQWILEQTGIMRLLFGPNVPELLAGPSLALIVIMIFTIWTYVGYDTAIFLAGLVNIPGELYEAARIDGADGWSIFRHITLPLLSPTTFFLSLIAVIGSFQAFTQIWVLRTPTSAASVDTVSVYIFRTIQSADPNMAYGSAMSVVLFIAILLLTLIQNRIAEKQVFYG
jgi:multiple sugar transport system permease protein